MLVLWIDEIEKKINDEIELPSASFGLVQISADSELFCSQFSHNSALSIDYFVS